MADNKAFEILKRLKAVFDGAAPGSGAPSGTTPTNIPATNPASPNGNAAQTAQYNIDGGAPVFVNISDDGVADIDQNDSVFSDAAMTTPYPDGTYKVTGTDFSFTVAGGVVTAISDKDGKGAGTPVQSAPASNPAPVQAPAPVMQSVPQFKSQEEFKTYVAKFAGDSMPSTQDMWTLIQALFESVFGYQIQQKKNEDAIAIYEDNFKAQEKVINQQKEILRDVFTVVQEIAELPKGTPVETPKKQSVFSREPEDARDKKVAGIVSSLNKINAKTNAKA